MTTYTAGRYRVRAFVGPQNGEVTVITQTHANGSDEVVAEMTLRKEDLPDLQYALLRAVYAHGQYAIVRYDGKNGD